MFKLLRDTARSPYSYTNMVRIPGWAILRSKKLEHHEKLLKRAQLAASTCSTWDRQSVVSPPALHFCVDGACFFGGLACLKPATTLRYPLRRDFGLQSQVMMASGIKHLKSNSHLYQIHQFSTPRLLGEPPEATLNLQECLCTVLLKFIEAAREDYVPYCAVMAYAFVIGDTYVTDGSVEYPVPERTQAYLLAYLLCMLPGTTPSTCQPRCKPTPSSRFSLSLAVLLSQLLGNPPLPQAQGYPFLEVLDIVLSMSEDVLTKIGAWESQFQGLQGVPSSLRQKKCDINMRILEARYGWILAMAPATVWRDVENIIYMFYHVPKLLSGP